MANLWDLAVLTVIGLSISGQPPAAGPTPPAAGSSAAPLAGSDDLLKRLLGQPPAPRTEADPAAAAKAGEDVQPLLVEHPLADVGQQMVRVRELLRHNETSKATQQLQLGIVNRLEALIAGAQQQPQQQPAARADGADGARSAERSDDSGAAAGPAQGPGATFNVESTVGTETWMQRIWGHLPDRLRSTIETPVHETFLPAYEDLIIEYYKRLSELDR